MKIIFTEQDQKYIEFKGGKMVAKKNAPQRIKDLVDLATNGSIDELINSKDFKPNKESE